MANGKSIPASRLRAMLARQLQVLEALGDAEVPASAHNGAMSSYQSVLAAARAAGVAPQGPGAQGPEGAAREPGAGTPESGAGTGHVRGQVDLSAEQDARNAEMAKRWHAEQDQADRQLAQQVAAARLERAQAEAARRFPAAVPLLDMVDASPLAENDFEGYMAQVAQLHQALGGQEVNAEPASPPEPPVMAGNPPMAAPDPAAQLDEIKARGRAGDPNAWADYYRLKEQQARGL